MSAEWLAFIIGVIFWQIIKMLYMIINRAVIERRQKRVVRVVQALFPDNTKVTFAAVDSSDKRAMDKIMKQLHDQGTVDQKAMDDYDLYRSPKKDKRK